MEVISILEKMVSFPVLGGQSNLSIAHWIEKYLESYDVNFRRVPNHDGTKHSLHCRIGPPVDGGIILSGHMDVVPVEGQPWVTDPFVLTERGGLLYGRGSCDMKGFLACCLSLVPDLQKAQLKKPVYFAFSYDEEIGCLAGPALAQDINDYYEEKPAYAWVGEPSLMQPMLGQKGIVIISTEVNGSAGHSSRIRTEVSAIHESARLILWLENKMNDLIESGHVDDRFEPPHTSIHIGQFFESGIAPNVVSDKALFTCDIRVIPKDVSKEIIQEYRDHCKGQELKLRERFPDFSIKIEYIHSDVPPLDTPERLDVVPLIGKWSGNSNFGAVSYAAEAGQFSNEGFQTFICGPGSIEQAHRANEFVAISELEKCQKALKSMIHDFSN